jgi:hypothetical protein
MASEKYPPEEYAPEPGTGPRVERSPEELEEAVAAKLHEGEPAIDVADLHVNQTEGEPVIEGRVGSEKDKQWALGLARNVVGQEVHDGLQVDESLPRTAPEEVTSGFEQDSE